MYRVICYKNVVVHLCSYCSESLLICYKNVVVHLRLFCIWKQFYLFHSSLKTALDRTCKNASDHQYKQVANIQSNGKHFVKLINKPSNHTIKEAINQAIIQVMKIYSNCLYWLLLILLQHSYR